MALRLYLDDSADARPLERLRRVAGHSVVTPGVAGLLGARDDAHLAYAVENKLILVTKNHKDFEPLYQGLSRHPGAFLIRLDNDPARDMTWQEIVQAITNLGASGVPIANEIHTLNHWRY